MSGLAPRCLFFLFPPLFLALTVSAESLRPIDVRVEVVEVDETRAERLGVQWASTTGFQEVLKSGVSIGSIDRVPGLRADLEFLTQKGVAQMLANPNLVTDSGTEAAFQAGGEIPYITTASLGASNVQFKPYGVQLRVKPTRVDSGKIRLKIQATVSSPDATSGAILSGQSVPGLLERHVSSEVTLTSQETVTLAGLRQTRREINDTGVPFLRRLPLVGVLFRWKQTIFRRTSIIVFVTPEVIETD